ncbi:MAG: endonuclease domain-containing protein [Candidatus Binataceae bacterium]
MRVLRDRRLAGVKFRRQVPIGPYFADFCCIGRKLIIELDGVYHAETGEHDLRREGFLRTKGFEILRFPCADLSRNRSNVLERILLALNAE